LGYAEKSTRIFPQRAIHKTVAKHLKMNSETINTILDKSKNSDFIDISDNDIRPILSYLKDDIKAIKIYDGKVIITEIGLEIIHKGGWFEYNKFLNDIKDTEIRKLKIDLSLAEKTLNEFPRTKWFAIIGFFTGIGLSILELIKWLITQN